MHHTSVILSVYHSFPPSIPDSVTLSLPLSLPPQLTEVRVKDCVADDERKFSLVSTSPPLDESTSLQVASVYAKEGWVKDIRECQQRLGVTSPVTSSVEGGDGEAAGGGGGRMPETTADVQEDGTASSNSVTAETEQGDWLID